MYAMSAAAAVWRLARGCALGHLAACSCATPPRREPAAPSALSLAQASSSGSSSSISAPLSHQAALAAFGPPEGVARGAFKWGGCGDDVRSASRIAKRFLQGSSPTPGAGPHAKFVHAVNMHNNRAGRRVRIPSYKIFYFYHEIFIFLVCKT